MKKANIAAGAAAGGVSSIAVIGLFYMGQQLFSFPQVPFDLFDWLARVLPGDIITLGIDGIVGIIEALDLGPTSSSAKFIEQLLAASMFIVLGAVFGVILAFLSIRVRGFSIRFGLAGGAVVLVLVLLMESSLAATGLSLGAIFWTAAIFLVWGALLASLAANGDAAASSGMVRADRRAMLLRIGAGSLGLAAGSWGIGRFLSTKDEDVGASQPLTVSTPTPSSSPQPTPLASATAMAVTRDSLSPVPGTRDELTETDDFYRIDINTFQPVLREFEWELEVDGLFDNPRALKLEDLMAFPAVTQPITLSCISNRIGGDLIGTANWTGLRLRDFLEDLGLQRQAEELMVEAADGFFESVTMKDMMDPRTLLVYGMNGKTLQTAHGYPLRIYIPNRYGMKQPKWITKITAIDHEGSGYWVDRGWSKTAHPQIISVIDTVAKDKQTQDGLIPIGGIAWAGDRGIQQVELQFNDGDWVQAALRVPPLSPLTWVQWRYDWDAPPGANTIRVRAVDGTGALQIEDESGVRPDGATGFHSVDVRI